MSKKLFSTAALVCCFVLCMAAVLADITGKWQGNITGPDGEALTLTYNFKIDGDKISGTGESNGNTVNIDEGKMNGADITFKVTNTDGIVMPHKGKYFADGDSISMNIDYNGTMFHTTLKRQK